MWFEVVKFLRERPVGWIKDVTVIAGLRAIRAAHAHVAMKAAELHAQRQRESLRRRRHIDMTSFIYKA